MSQFSRWWAEIVAAVMPLPLGGVAVYLFQGSGAGDAMSRWVSDGMLMPPAALLCISLLWTIHELREHAATPYVKTAVTVLMFLAALVFAASVQPAEERALSDGQLFSWNVVLYLFVIASCAVVAYWKSRKVAA